MFETKNFQYKLGDAKFSKTGSENFVFCFNFFSMFYIYCKKKECAEEENKRQENKKNNFFNFGKIFPQEEKYDKKVYF